MNIRQILATPSLWLPMLLNLMETFMTEPVFKPDPPPLGITNTLCHLALETRAPPFSILSRQVVS